MLQCSNLCVFVNCSWEQFYSNNTKGHSCDWLCCNYVLQLYKERNMNIGKYTYIYNMLPWYSSRKILCLLKKKKLIFGSWGRKERRVGWLGFFFFSIFTSKILRLVALTIYFDGVEKNINIWWNNLQVLEDPQVYCCLNAEFFKMWFI